MKTALLAALLICGTAAAQTPVADIESTPGEDKGAFLLRAARVAADYTTKSGHESCGSLATREDGSWAIRLVSSGEQLACEWTPADTVAGYAATEESLHSHPRVESLIPAGATSRERHAMKVSFGPSGCTFSPHDMATGAGYLVACGKLLHHDGSGKITSVNTLSRR